MTKKGYRVLCVALISLVFLFSLVGQPLQEKRGKVATDALERSVTLEGPIETILVAGRAAVMPADALFMFPIVDDVAVVLAKTDQGLGDFFPLLDSKYGTTERLGQKAGVEEILAYNPSLIITKANNYDSVVKLLEPFNVPLFVMDLETSEAWKGEISELGKLLGDAETPKKIINLFNQREERVANKISTLEEAQKPTVLVLQTSVADSVTAFSIAPNNWIQTMLVEQAGGIPVWVEGNLTSNAWRKVSFEQIASWDPDEIILVNYSTPPNAFIEEIRGSRQWASLKAVKSGKLYSAPADLMSYFQSDSRWILALEWLSAKLHPTLFADFEMEEAIRSFYQEFYNIEDQVTLTTLVEAYRRGNLY
ncbi:MAG: ABC transporter substrate-binding protein [Sphaerochaetaceae bacterium]|nr:ABC transporter substrate-binding protein [Sphaerochaetaceae bacterium]